MSGAKRTLVLLVALTAGCTDSPVAPGTPVSDADLRRTQDQGSRLVVNSGNAVGFRDKRSEFAWSMHKRVSAILAGEHMEREASTSETTLELYQKDEHRVKWIEYEIQATRTGPIKRSVTGVRGGICLTNAPGMRQQALRIATSIAQVAGPSGHRDVVAPRVHDVSEKPVLGGGESHCYPFEISFTGSSDVEYRVTTVVTAVRDGLGEDEGFRRALAPLASDVRLVRIPSASTPVTSNATAHVWDGHGAAGNLMGTGREGRDLWTTGGCAELWPLFQCTSDTDWGDWDFTGTTTVHYMVDVGNMHACGAPYVLHNRAVLTPSGTGYPGAEREEREITASLTLHTPKCPPTHSCPLTAESYAHRDAIWPRHVIWNEPLQGRPFFDSGLTWKDMVASSDDHEYAHLGREYVAATLNLANNAAISKPERTARGDAAFYFSSDPAHRALVSHQTLAEWTRTLARFNDGHHSKSCRADHGDHDEDHADDDDGHETDDDDDHGN